MQFNSFKKYAIQLSVDGRSADVEALVAMYGAAAANCDAKSVSSGSFNAEAWTWPGSFDFGALDSALASFFDCANAAAVVVNLFHF